MHAGLEEAETEPEILPPLFLLLKLCVGVVGLVALQGGEATITEPHHLYALHRAGGRENFKINADQSAGSTTPQGSTAALI